MNTKIHGVFGCCKPLSPQPWRPNAGSGPLSPYHLASDIPAQPPPVRSYRGFPISSILYFTMVHHIYDFLYHRKFPISGCWARANQESSQLKLILLSCTIMGRPAGFNASDNEEKKSAIAAVVDFCDSTGVDYSKTKLFKHFGVPIATGYMWFPAGASPKSRKPPQEMASPVKKRFTSEDETDGTSSNPSTSQSLGEERRNPIRNGGRDRKRLKSMVLEDNASSKSPPIPSPSLTHSSSSPPPEQLLAPPKRKNSQSRKEIASKPVHQSENEVEGVEINREI